MIFDSMKRLFTPEPPKDMEADPERALYVPGRRAFLFLGASAAAGALLPKLPMVAGETSGVWGNGASVLRRGDVFTISGVYSVNPLSYVSTGRLQRFVVMADTTPDKALTMCSPRIITSGQLQTVTRAPSAGARVDILPWKVGKPQPITLEWHEWGGEA